MGGVRARRFAIQALLGAAAAPATALCLFAGASPTVGQVPAAVGQDASAASAQAWLSLIDLQRYGEAYGSTGEIFRTSVTPDDWRRKLASAREPLGPVRSRSLMTNEARTELPGAPDGDWRILRFSTTFANKAAAVETVVLRREEGGYAVEGYFVR